MSRFLHRQKTDCLFVGAAAAALALVVLFWVLAKQPDDGVGRRQHWKFRRVASALEDYWHGHGEWPFDARGSEYALYVLQDRLDQGELPSAVPNQAFWDHREGRVRDTSVCYWNSEENRDRRRDRVVVAMPSPVDLGTVYFSTGSGEKGIHFGSDGDASVCLGLWHADGFLFRDKQLYDKWQELALPPPEHDVVPSHGRWRKFVHPLVTVEHTYADGVLKSRVVTAKGCEIVDRISTDRNGVITGIERTPERWMECLPNWTGKTVRRP